MPETACDGVLRTFLEDSPIGVAILDIATGKRLFANARLVEMFAAGSREALLEGDIGETWVDPADLERAFTIFKRRERLVNFEARRRRLDGSLWWVLMNTQPVSFAGKDAGIVWHIDITDRKAATEQLVHAKFEAEQASRAKSEFLAHVSHELRTPLNCILGFSQVLGTSLAAGTGTRNSEYVRYIHDSGQHLLGIINDILDISKIEAGEFELHETDFDLAEVLDSARQMLRGLAADSRVSVDVAPPTGGRALLHADRRVVMQIAVNLLSNAIKFNRKGGNVALTLAPGDGGGWTVTVRDTGIGIAAADIPKVLQPFGQVRSGSHRAHGGTGLGLSLSKNLMELHGGTLTMTSEPGQGTTVEIAFPPDRTRA